MAGWAELMGMVAMLAAGLGSVWLLENRAIGREERRDQRFLERLQPRSG